MIKNNVTLLQKTQAGIADGTLQNPIVVQVYSENQGNFHSVIKMRNHSIESDQPSGFRGQNKGPKPSELVLAALAACQETTWRIYAEVLGITIDKISIEIKGIQDLRGFMNIDKNIPAGFQKIEGDILIESSSPKEELEKLKNLVDEHCPVLDDLTRIVPVSFNLSLKSGK